ncbi:hypothetical protein PV733_31350 [Streptomyces europaeiscabiei]|uniref:hypothetical protein n=1 Tax=Streptomyces europaeiscabiei TaxID=146819 RepID=UPI0029BC0778|nr:hypothetical protein [Streptomyces europaeiscabiei]MDX3713359.1 hypothetical protein [Streptomyces europaeiscabiei]
MSEVEKYITDEMRQEVYAARREALQSDLRLLAARIRNEAPDGSADFQAGIDWAALLVENIANQLTQ